MEEKKRLALQCNRVFGSSSSNGSEYPVLKSQKIRGMKTKGYMIIKLIQVHLDLTGKKTGKEEMVSITHVESLHVLVA